MVLYGWNSSHSNSFPINSMVVLTFTFMRIHGSVEKVTGLRIRNTVIRKARRRVTIPTTCWLNTPWTLIRILASIMWMPWWVQLTSTTNGKVYGLLVSTSRCWATVTIWPYWMPGRATSRTRTALVRMRWFLTWDVRTTSMMINIIWLLPSVVTVLPVWPRKTVGATSLLFLAPGEFQRRTSSMCLGLMIWRLEVTGGVSATLPSVIGIISEPSTKVL